MLEAEKVVGLCSSEVLSEMIIAKEDINLFTLDGGNGAVDIETGNYIVPLLKEMLDKPEGERIVVETEG